MNQNKLVEELEKYLKDTIISIKNNPYYEDYEVESQIKPYSIILVKINELKHNEKRR